VRLQLRRGSGRLAEGRGAVARLRCFLPELRKACAPQNKGSRCAGPSQSLGAGLPLYEPHSGGLAKVAVVVAVLIGFGSIAHAEDRVDTTITWFQERRAQAAGDKKSLDVYHPQLDLGIDLGEWFSLSAGYEADIVSGATESLYAASTNGVDVVSSATTFDDTRQVGKAGLAFTGRRSRLFGGYSYGFERDYKSHSVTVGASIDLPGKNTTFAVTYTHNFDKVCDLDNGDATPLERRTLSGANACFVDGDADATTLTHAVSIDTTEASLTQNLSPTAVLQLGLNGQVIDGFQSNPYRAVRVAGVDAQESSPFVRGRLALFARLRLAFPRAHGALGVDLRGYSDTWGVDSGTVEMSYHQYLGQKILFRLRARAYQQTKAVFFEDAIDYANFGATGAFFTGDRELSPLRNELVGAKMSYLAVADDAGLVWGLFDEIDFHLRAEGIWAQSLTDTPPGGDVGGPLPDMIIVSLGLLMRY
jgi:hypothetical protein